MKVHFPPAFLPEPHNPKQTPEIFLWPISEFTDRTNQRSPNFSFVAVAHARVG